MAGRHDFSPAGVGRAIGMVTGAVLVEARLRTAVVRQAMDWEDEAIEEAAGGAGLGPPGESARALLQSALWLMSCKPRSGRE